MSKFNEGMSVMIIDEDNIIRKGKVQAAYDELKVAIVKFEDGATEKVPYDMIGIEVAKSESQDTEPIESKRITMREFISHVCDIAFSSTVRDKFRDKSVPVSKGVLAGGMSLIDILFEDNSEIELTRNQLNDALIKMSFDAPPGCHAVAMLNSLILRDLIEIIFD